MSIRSVLMVVLCSFILACSTVDDYILGKDNTPKPAALEPVASKVKVAKAWSVPTGKSKKSDKYLKLKPVVMNHVVYTANASGLVQAVDQNLGTTIWSKQLKHGLVSGPTVKNGFIAFGTNASSVVVLRQKDGAEQWTTKVSSDALSKPVIVADHVIVKTIDGNLYSLDLKNGKQTWVSNHGSPSLILKASSSPVILDKVALVGYSDGKLDAIDLSTGSVVWQRGIAYATGPSDVERLVDIDADPIIQDKLVYLASYQGYVGALSLTNGEFIWRKPASTYNNISLDTHHVYLTDSDDVVWAYDKHSGQVKWKQPVLKARGLTEPVLMGQFLLVGDKTGYVHVLSTQNGSILSRLHLGGPVYSAPTVKGTDAYVMTGNGKLSRILVG